MKNEEVREIVRDEIINMVSNYELVDYYKVQDIAENVTKKITKGKLHDESDIRDIARREAESVIHPSKNASGGGFDIVGISICVGFFIFLFWVAQP